jgi:hypothetical protein
LYGARHCSSRYHSLWAIGVGSRDGRGKVATERGAHDIEIAFVVSRLPGLGVSKCVPAAAAEPHRTRSATLTTAAPTTANTSVCSRATHHRTPCTRRTAVAM